jgi:hypothetical protein
MSVLQLLKDLNNNKFLFQKFNYTYTKKHKDKKYKANYIKNKTNILEFVIFEYYDLFYKQDNDLIYYIDITFKNDNFTHRLLRYFINKKINKLTPNIFTKLSHSNINIDILLNYITCDWDWELLSFNVNIDIEDIFKYEYLEWDFKKVLRNPNLTMELFEDVYPLYVDPENNIYSYLSELTYNPNITIGIIEKYPFINWNWSIISHNIKKLTKQQYVKYINKWNYTLLSTHINFNIYDEYHYHNWNYYKLSENKNLDIYIVLNHLDKNWNWSKISSNKNILIKHIIKYPELNWDWSNISLNPNITIQFIKENLDKDWNTFNVSSNPNITMDDIEKNNMINWNYEGICINPNLTIDFIRKNIKKLKLSNIFYNEFLYNDIVFNNTIKIDRQKRKNDIDKVLHKKINSDMLFIILEYIDYE